MKLKEFLKLIDIDITSHTALDRQLKDVETNFSEFTDRYILTQTVNNRIKKLNIGITQGKPNQNLNVTPQEIKNFILNSLIHDEKLLSELISQLDNCRNANPIKEAIIKKHTGNFVKEFAYSKDRKLEEAAYGYIATKDKDFLFLKKGNRHIDLNNRARRGWKFHISLEDSKINQVGEKINVSAAWDALLTCFFSHQIEVVKVVTAIAMKDADCQTPTTAGKQITIYAGEFVNDLTRCERFLNEVTRCLVNHKILPSYRPKGDKAFPGSEFISYRWDTYSLTDSRFGRRREGEPYKPDDVIDIFQAIEAIKIFQSNKSKGEKQIVVGNTNTSNKPTFSLDLSKLKR